jgi:hypothetical protein
VFDLITFLTDEIEVNYLGCDCWYPAIYVQSIDASTARVRYVDGDQEEDVSIDWIRLPPAAVSAEASVDISEVQVMESTTVAAAVSTTEDTESKNLQPHHLSSSPQSDNIVSSFYLNGQMSIPSTVTSIGAIGSDEDIQYEHKIGIGTDDSPSLTSYEILHAIARLHGALAKKYPQQESSPSFYSQLCERAVQYFNDASTDAFDSGKTAFAMKCLEDAAEFE